MHDLIAKFSGSTIFNGNSGSNGRCIFVECSLYLEGIVSFTNCSAAQDGGAIHTSEIHAHFGSINVFNANRAVHFGGALYICLARTPLPPT